MKDVAINDYKTWNRAVLHFLWVLVALTIVMGEVTYILSSRTGSIDWRQPVPDYLLQLSMLYLGLMLLAEGMYRLMKHAFDYVLISITFVIGLLLILFLSSKQPVEGLLLIALDLPLMMSMFYFSVRKVWYALVLTLVGFIVLYPFMETLRQEVDMWHMIALIGMLLGTGAIAIVICRRGVELTQALERAVHSEMHVFAEVVELEGDSHKDYLTGLYKHSVFHQYMATLTEQHRAHGMPLQLALLDLDSFKSVNDTYGHQAGDRVLREMGSILSEFVSSSDVAFRYGGEEFAVIWTGRSMSETLERLEAIRERMASTIFPEMDNRIVTVSIGCADYRGDLDKEPFFKLTDELLYEAKRQGKNRIVHVTGGEP
ncbi:diguanylate cyclase [Paenibacillus sp. YYML68]|uniref:GGDEF domain-containing protein n=1 Tax=Paenibacillus sp. YYML68 TaxID=2909250 RepID=UPI0024907F2A|nr:GGDEF domain-containing protein [Paenibacillus sp. YYML68]